MSKALIIVDVQHDFSRPEGSLYVPEGEKIIQTINDLADAFDEAGEVVVKTRDWHPQVTVHFESSGGLWPSHCVQDTWGGEFDHELRAEYATVISKGMSPKSDSYSGFDGITNMDVPLIEYLQSYGVNTIYIVGLATDYCVKHTALDARILGSRVIVVEDAIKAVNIMENDGANAIHEMKNAGIEFIQSGAVKV